MKYQEALDYMESQSGRGIVPGLSRIERLCALLGNPQEDLKFVHIAGTNGKGSTLAYISTVLKCAGFRVGRYLSPVIFEYREKIQVNGRPITKKALCEGVELVRAACSKMAEEGLESPTAFEAETALALWYFREKKCDVVVLETGMGGLQDATNIVWNVCVSVITPIGMDHMKFLGGTVEEIASQKAGIMKTKVPVVTARQRQEVYEVLKQRAQELGCKLVCADEGTASCVRYGVERQRFHYGAYRNLEIRLAGKFQIANAALAIEAVRILTESGFPVNEEQLREGLRKTVWPGRFEVIGRKPLFVIDGAHNEDAAKKLAESLEFYFAGRRILFIMGMFRDKEYEKVIRLTHGFADQIITVTPPVRGRAMSAYELAREVAKVHPQVTAVDSLEEAVEMSYLLAGKEDVILAFGSLSYLGDLTRIVRLRK